MMPTNRCEILALNHDCLLPILDLLSAEDICNLYVSGDIAFNQVLVRFLRSIRVEYRDKVLMKWPRVLARFTSVSSLYFAPALEEDFLRNIIPDLDIKFLPKSLRSLTLLCPNALAIFLEQVDLGIIFAYSMIDVAVFFPELETLTLSTALLSQYPLIRLDPSKFPRALKHLQFEGPAPHFKASQLGDLPKGLQHTRFALIDDVDSDDSTVEFPPALTSLDITFTNLKHRVWLPTTIATLKVKFQHLETIESAVAPFPRSVTDLEVAEFDLTVEAAKKMIPPNLTRLTWRGPAQLDALIHLSPNNTLLYANFAFLALVPTRTVIRFPESVTEVAPSHPQYLPLEVWKNPIPKWQSHFVVRPASSPESISGAIDQNRREEYISSQLELFERIKGQIRQLSAAIYSGFHLVISTPLPHLTHLMFLLGDTQLKESTIASDWMKWCPSLTYLESEAPLDMVELCKAPFILNELYANSTPRSLQDCFTQDDSKETDGFALRWAHYRPFWRLRKLSINLNLTGLTTTSHKLKEDGIPTDFIAGLLAELPSSLSYLWIREATWSEDSPDYLIPSRVFGNLPRNLQSLYLGPIEIYPPAFRPSDINLLPRSLTELDIACSRARQLEWSMSSYAQSDNPFGQAAETIAASHTFCDLHGEELVGMLPKNLRRFSLPTGRHIASITQYCSSSMPFLMSISWKTATSSQLHSMAPFKVQASSILLPHVE